MAFGVRDVQRCWLDLTVMLNYMEVYKPWMDSARLATSSPPVKVANTIGAFTSDIHVAQDFFHAGLPFWLIRPASDLGHPNILRAVPLSVPHQNGICFESHRFKYPIIYQGLASSTQKHDAILQCACNFLRYLDPFAVHTSEMNASPSGHVESSARLQASKDEPGTRAIVGISRQCSANSGRDWWGIKGKGAVHKQYEFVFSSAISLSHNR